MADLRNLTFAINIKGNEDKVVKTDRAMDDLVKTTGKTTKELASTSKGIENIGSAKNIDGVNKGKRSIENITKSLDSTQTKLKDVSGGMKKLGGDLTKFVTLPLAGVGIAAVKMNQDLKKDLATISTLIPGQSERLGVLRKDIQRVSIDVAKGTDEIADATYGIISAYGDAEDTMDKVALNAKAATAGVASTSDALNLSSAVMKGYGDTSAKANEKVLDLAFGTLKLGQTDFSSLANSIGQVVPLATELSISQEELFGVYAAATGVTGDASKVSTQYRGILQSLMAPTKEMTKLMNNMGYTSGKSMIEGEGLGRTIQAIDKASKDGNIPLKDFIGSIEGQTLALSLAGNLSESYTTKTEELANASGMATEAFKEQTEGVNASGFSYAQSMQRMKVASQELGEAASPMIATLADGFAFVSEKLVALDPETLQLITKIGLIALALGPVIKFGGLAISGISKAIGVVGTVTAFLGKAGFAISAVAGGAATLGEGMLLVMGPVGWVIAGFVALTAAGVAVYKNWGTISQWAKDKGAEISKDWQDTKDKTVAAWNDTKDGISTAIGKIKEHAQGLKDFFKNPIKGTVEIARNIRDKVTGARSTTVDGSHATGLARVPKDNYVANLHKNEEILRADDPRNQNNPNFNPKPQPRSGGIVFSPTYNIELSGTATESDKQEIEKVIDKKTRELFDIFFKEMNMKMA